MMASEDTTGTLGLAAGTRVGAYTITERIAVGGMGVVYKAHDPALDRLVALKVMHPAMARLPELATRFLWEAQAVARLEHPNIVRIYAAGKSRFGYYMAMQLFNGDSLAKIIRTHGPLPPEVALRVVKQVASALQVAHRAGIVHRDINSNNIMLNSACVAVVTDFGLSETRDTLSRLAKESEDYFLGTPEYASPEQWQNEDVDERTDIYSLGVSLYEMVVGQLPYVSEEMADLATIVAHGLREPLAGLCPHLPASVIALIDVMMEPKSTDRMRSAIDVERTADRIIASLRARLAGVEAAEYAPAAAAQAEANAVRRRPSQPAAPSHSTATRVLAVPKAPAKPGVRAMCHKLGSKLRAAVKRFIGPRGGGDGARKAAAL
ncbi:MAG: serine/threonine-protein kinase [Planctomycetota bacterium]|nr:serine/threonine-protein kinase [Planctomycetota bacterium]